MELVQTCLRRGADTFLIKPLNLGQAMHIWQFLRKLPPGIAPREVRPQQVKRDRQPARATTLASSSVPIAGTDCAGRGSMSLANHRSTSDPIPGVAASGPCDPASSASERQPRTRAPLGTSPGDDELDPNGVCKQQ